MSRILVVYYSRTGNTRMAAKAIAEACGADLEEIRDARPRRGPLGWVRSLAESLRKRPAAILPVRHDPADYGLVLLGTPVWASAMSSPLRRYLEDHKARLPEIAVFETEGGRGGEAAARQIAAFCGKTPRATLVLTAAQMKSKAWRERARAFARKLVPPSTRATVAAH